MKTSSLQACLFTMFVLVGFIAKTQNATPAPTGSWSLNGNSGIVTNKNFLGTTDTKPVVFRTNNLERMRLTKNGDVGLGTTLPSGRLNIIGTTYVSLKKPGYVRLGDSSGYNMGLDVNVIQARFADNASGLYLNYYGGLVWLGSRNGSAIPALYAATNGSVGVGSSTIQNGYALTVNPFSSGGAIYINDPGNGNVLYSNKSGSTGEGLRVNITSSTNPYSCLRGNTSGNGYGVLAEATGTFGFGVEGYSTHSYGLWAGTGNSGTYAAYIAGDIYVNGSYLGSDQNLKQEIEDISSSAVDIINQLHPRQYKYRQDGYYKLMNFPDGEHYGLIAQDIEKVLPNLVKETKFITSKAVPSQSDALKNAPDINFKAVNYNEFIPLLIKAVQEQQQQIDELKSEVAKLTRANNSTELSAAYLKQNAPNPFSKNTVISCFVPESSRQAQLVIHDQAGRQLQTFTLSSKGINNITISAGSLSSGQYIFSLLIDGKKADSKSMVLTK